MVQYLSQNPTLMARMFFNILQQSRVLTYPFLNAIPVVMLMF